MTALAIDGLVLAMEEDLGSSVRDLIQRVRETGRGVVLGDVRATWPWSCP